MTVELPDATSQLGQAVQQALAPGEEVLAAVLSGASGMTLHSVLIATNLGAMIVKKRPVSTYRLPYWQIASVTQKRTPLWSGQVVIRAAGVTPTFEVAVDYWGNKPTEIRERQLKPGEAARSPNGFIFNDTGDRYERVREVVDFINEQVARARMPANQSPANIPEQIRQLAALRDDGIISNEDFEAKKAELLTRM